MECVGEVREGSGGASRRWYCRQVHHSPAASELQSHRFLQPAAYLTPIWTSPWASQIKTCPQLNSRFSFLNLLPSSRLLKSKNSASLGPRAAPSFVASSPDRPRSWLCPRPWPCGLAYFEALLQVRKSFQTSHGPLTSFLLSGCSLNGLPCFGGKKHKYIPEKINFDLKSL